MVNNIDTNEVKKFSVISGKWWDKNGLLKALHQINPLRLKFIEEFTDLNNKMILDIGCGGGILSESMAKKGAIVSGLDASSEVIKTAKQRAFHSNLEISYFKSTIEDFSKNKIKNFDIISCMEMLEHVPNPESVIVNIAKIIKQNGYLFISTLNRNIKSYLLSIIVGEHILKIIPKGTHEYSKYIKPYELVRTGETCGFKVLKIIGISYNLITNSFKFCKKIDVNYIVAFQKI